MIFYILGVFYILGWDAWSGYMDSSGTERGGLMRVCIGMMRTGP